MPGSFIFLINPFSKKDFDVSIAKNLQRVRLQTSHINVYPSFYDQKNKKSITQKRNMKYCVLGFNYFVIVYIEYKIMCVSMKSAHVW